MDVRDAVFLVILLFVGKVLSVKADNSGTQFQIDVKYNGAYCYDESDVNTPVSSDIFCAHRCSHNQACNGFFYNTITGQCSTVKNVPERTEACQDKIGSVFYRKLDCGDAPDVNNSILQSRVGEGMPGTVLNYSCQDGYGSPANKSNYTVTCQKNGTWTDVNFECKKDCSEPSTIDNATLDVGDTVEGTVRTYTCLDNYATITGSVTTSVTCANTGEWTQPAETCLRNCSEPIMMNKATIDTGNTHEGAIRTFTCHDNYITATGSKTIAVICTSTGDWTPPTETCLRNCSEPSPMGNAVLDTGDTHEGTVRNYTCLNNYITATGSMTNSVTCSNTGEWTPLPEPCLRDCSEPGMVDNTTLDTGHTHENSIRTYTCLDGFITATGLMNVTVTCARTWQWTTPNETCLKNCGNPPEDAHGTLHHGRTHEGSAAHLICDKPYSLKVNGIISYGQIVVTKRCQSSGEWDSGECVLACNNSVDLVTGNDGIADNRITATSMHDDNYAPRFGRLDSSSSWIAATYDTQQHIQFRFHVTMIVNEIVTQNFHGPNWMVTSYKVHYSTDCDVFTEYNQTFQGNTIGNSHVSNEINPAILAYCVRVNPQTWIGGIAMRVELRGC